MKHVYDPKEYPYANRKEDKRYEASPDFWRTVYTSDVFLPDTAAKEATILAHNVREAYPELAVASVFVKVPIIVELIVEGNRLSESDARLEAWRYVSSQLNPTSASVRSYSAALKEETGRTLRQALTFIGTPWEDSSQRSAPFLKAPTPTELEGWDA